MGSLIVSEYINLLQTLTVNASESISASDSSSSLQTILTSNVSDVIATQDTVALSQMGEGLNISVSESVVVEEPGLYSRYITSTDSVGISESTPLNISAPSILEINKSDSIIYSDYVDRFFKDLLINKFDSVSIQEFADRLFFLTINVFDTITQEKGIRIVQTDDVSLSDFINTIIHHLVINVSDIVQVATAVSEVSKSIPINVSDNITESEFLGLELPVIPIEVSDSISVTEEFEGFTSELAIYVNENLSLTDSSPDIIFSSAFLINQLDNVAVSENTDQYQGMLVAEISDSIPVSDGIGIITHNLCVDVVESIILSETRDNLIGQLILEVNDALGLSEYVDSEIISQLPREVSVYDNITVREIEEYRRYSAVVGPISTWNTIPGVATASWALPTGAVSLWVTPESPATMYDIVLVKIQS